jgi:DNA-binding CsgD family transcriptional regulator/tetratricopeptide (TPR) repeat protein
LADRGEMGRATGWFGRAQRLLAQERDACVEHGYMLVPVIQRQLAVGDAEAAYAAAQEAAAIGRRFGDADLFALALHGQGRARLRAGRVEEGLALLDEAMVAVTGDELSPIVSGVIYCSVIGACHEVYAVRRAHEWTAALTRWCEAQPDLVPFSGQCRIHRSEVMQFRGAWHEALEEARSARARAERGEPRRVSAGAWYQAAELHRLLGQFDDAEAAYRRAAELGREPQPGLALLWWARGRVRRRVGSDRAGGARGIVAAAEVSGASGLPPAHARGGSARRRLARPHGAGAARRDLPHRGADRHRRRGSRRPRSRPRRRPRRLAGAAAAWHAWQALGAPYEPPERASGSRGLPRRGRRGDRRTGAGAPPARPTCAWVPRPTSPGWTGLRADAGHTASRERELEVLRLLAAGSTNRAIAEALGISRRTVDRHVSNIFDKLGVSSRAAATARAYERDLL